MGCLGNCSRWCKIVQGREQGLKDVWKEKTTNPEHRHYLRVHGKSQSRCFVTHLVGHGQWMRQLRSWVLSQTLTWTHQLWHNTVYVVYLVLSVGHLKTKLVPDMAAWWVRSIFNLLLELAAALGYLYPVTGKAFEVILQRSTSKSPSSWSNCSSIAGRIVNYLLFSNSARGSSKNNWFWTFRNVFWSGNLVTIRSPKVNFWAWRL